MQKPIFRPILPGVPPTPPAALDTDSKEESHRNTEALGTVSHASQHTQNGRGKIPRTGMCTLRSIPQSSKRRAPKKSITWDNCSRSFTANADYLGPMRLRRTGFKTRSDAEKWRAEQLSVKNGVTKIALLSPVPIPERDKQSGIETDTVTLILECSRLDRVDTVKPDPKNLSGFSCCSELTVY